MPQARATLPVRTPPILRSGWSFLSTESSRSRAITRIVLGGVLALAALLSGTTAAEPTASEPEIDHRSRVLRLLTEVHSPSSSVRLQAEQELDAIGIRGEELRLARMLKHPDRAERLKLVRELPEVAEPLRRELVDQMSADPDPAVRDAIRSAFATLDRSAAIAAGQPALKSDLQKDSLAAVIRRTQSHIELIAAETTFPLLPPPDNSPDEPDSGSGQLSSTTPERQPQILQRPLERPAEDLSVPLVERLGQPIESLPEAPNGFTGPSSILPRDQQVDEHFIPQPDRWRNSYPRHDRYGAGFPWLSDYIGVEGNWWDPYNQNVLKGDFPIMGQHTFMNITANSQTVFDFREVPTPTTPFESTRSPGQEEFFGRPQQTTWLQNLSLRVDLFHGNQSAFKPLDWLIRLTPVVNVNQVHLKEQGLLDPDVRDGLTRTRDHLALQEWFGEVKLADLSPDYDFMSVRAGSQTFNSDFRGFIFFDTNRAVRLFGSRYSNRHQFNLVFFDMMEKETNAGLNTFHDRHQNVLIGNYYIQDFIFPGYTAQASFHMNHDDPSTHFDRNRFLVRPDPTGVFRPHRVESYYLGLAGDGHIGRFNISNAFYWVTGRDSLNPIGGQSIDINAYMAAVELSYDRDWARFRTSFFYSSGDDDPNDGNGEGFDAIMDNPVFAGGEFSYWQRQAIQLFGVRLVNDRSLVPNLRSSRIQGQSNFTNPGLLLLNAGVDFDITPKLRMINNINYLMFDKTEVLQTYVFQRDIDRRIGLDVSCGFEWRPFHNDNVIALFGVSALLPDDGFKDLYGELNSGETRTMYASFAELNLTY